MADERALNNFISTVKKDGLARTSRFNVVITPPKALLSNINNNNLILLCDKIDLPTISLATNDVQVYGESRAMPYQKMYDKVRLSFYVDMNMDIKKFFDRWLQIIIHPKSKNHYYYDDYITNIDIVVNNVAEKSIYKMTLNECYPSSIDGISLDYASKDIMKLNITINYKYFEISEFTNSGVTYDFTKPIDVSGYFSTMQQSAANYQTIQSMISGRASSIGYTANTVTSLVTNLTNLI